MLLTYLGPIVLGLLGSDVGAELPAPAAVVAESLDVFDEPDNASFATGRIKLGDRIVVLDELGEGWLAIEPPPGSISWIDQDTINDVGEGEARVIVPRTAVRPGRPGARMPGSAHWVLEQGETVRLVDQPSITLRQGRANHTWQAIEPPAIEVRYVRAEGVRFQGGTRGNASRVNDVPQHRMARTVRASERLDRVETNIASVGPGEAEGPLPADVAAAVSKVEALHRSILKQPVEYWQLEPVRQGYQKLLEHTTDPAVRAALRARLDRVLRQEALAKAARSFQHLLVRSRQLDQDVDRVRTPASEAPPAELAPYDAEGLLQKSSRQVDGQTVYALIGKKGQTVAYLNVPPGLEAGALVARRVGVRGAVRFNEALRTNLIIVRELDPLSDPP